MRRTAGVRRFAARIALLNALLAVVLFAITGTIAAFVTYASLQNAMAQNLSQAAREVPVVVGYYRLTTLDSAASRIVAQLRRPGVRALVHDGVTHRIYDGTSDAGIPERGLGDRGPGADGELHGRPLGDAGPPDGDARGPRGPLGPQPGRGDVYPLLAFLHVSPIEVRVRGGSVVLLPDPSSLGPVWQLFVLAMTLAGLLAAFVAWAIGGSVSRQSLRPLHEVTAELERFGGGDFTPRNVAALGEYAGLAQAYNRAALQVARAFEERSAAEREMRQFIADAAHELRTPLTIVTGYVELLRDGVDAARSEKIFATIGAEGERMRECIAKLIALARLDATSDVRRERVDLSALVERVADTFAGVDSSARLSVGVEPGLSVDGDSAELQEALANLLDNAIKYGDGARIRVVAERAGDDVCVAVSDEGPGMSEFEAANAFARFYRGEARGEREGSGLGLAIVARIAQRAGGSVTLETSPGGGATFALRLTAAAAA